MSIDTRASYRKSDYRWLIMGRLGLARHASEGAKSAMVDVRCAKAKHLCLGYKDDWDVIFRPLQLAESDSSHSETVERRGHPTVEIIQSPSISSFATLNDAEIEEKILDTFVEEFCAISSNPKISRGFLDGFESLVNHAGKATDIGQAATMVGLAGVANRIGRLSLHKRAELIYGRLLRSFQTSLTDKERSSSVESLMTAVLLGIYEVITSSKYHPGYHTAHVRGVSAILSQEDSPFDLDAGIQLFQLGDPQLLKKSFHVIHASAAVITTGVLCSPLSHDAIQNLDAMLIKFSPIFHYTNTLFSSSFPAFLCVETLLEEAMSLDEEFKRWPEAQEGGWLPQTAGTFSEQQTAIPGLPRLGIGRLDSYFDLFVAAVWNTYRKSHMMILNIIFRCRKHLGKEDAETELRERVKRLAEDIMASLPYHIFRDQNNYLELIEKGSRKLEIGQTAGGLLMMHPLYVVAGMSALSESFRTYARDSLAWIGRHMGVGQATILADPFCDLPFKYIAEGHILIWAGMLIRKT
ncbi:MAG: hypothetical protein M1820_003444 [Bogoriella megaspora]|nr:MAG: hypothetical protein M1820_003444 [Bogoriella megaspora]